MISSIAYLRCPKCKSNLQYSTDTLQCVSCRSKYTIKEGVVLLLNIGDISDHARGQIDYFEKEPPMREGAPYTLQPWQESFLSKFKENNSDIKDKVVVDCGAGSGYMTIELARQGAIVIALDLTLRSLIRLRSIAQQQGLLDRIIFVCCSAEELPLKNDIANYFISNAVLEHLPNEQSAINEMTRVCREKLMITVPLRYRYTNPLFIIIHWLYDKRIGHLRRYDEVILVKKLSGWCLQNIYYTGHTAKVFATGLNILFHNRFDTYKIELRDQRKQKNKWWASNIICFFKKNNI